MTKRRTNTTEGLRDILFEEIDQLRGKDGDPKRAMAVSSLSKQIIGTAKMELEFHRTMAQLQQQGATVNLGTLALGSK